MTKRVHCLTPGPRRLHHRRRQEARSRTESRLGIHPSAADDQAGARQSRQVATGTFSFENCHIGN